MMTIGIAGWGAAGQLMAAAVERRPGTTLVGVADLAFPEAMPLPEGVAECGSVQELLALGPDAVYLATPTETHAPLATEVLACGIHVVVEKPVASDLDEALHIQQAATRSSAQLIVGATHSFDAVTRELRGLVVSGELGDLGALSSHYYTDWKTRPRKPADLDASRGGGLVLRQGAHQIDVVRYIAGGVVESVSARTYGGSDGTESGYAAVLGFSGGVVASAHYAGGGGFDSRVLTGGVGELAELRGPDRVVDPIFPQVVSSGALSPMCGLTMATFDEADVMARPDGLLIFRSGHAEHRPLSPRSRSGWDAVLDELADVVAGDPPQHSAAWAIATLEVCFAIHAANSSGSSVRPAHQCPTPDTPNTGRTTS